VYRSELCDPREGLLIKATQADQNRRGIRIERIPNPVKVDDSFRQMSASMRGRNDQFSEDAVAFVIDSNPHACPRHCR
jgi:hypothetical protein